MENSKRFPKISSQTILLKVRQSSLQSRCVCAGGTLYVVAVVVLAVGFGLMNRKLGYMKEKLKNVSSITSVLNEEMNYMTHHSCANTPLSKQHQVALITTESGKVVHVVCDTLFEGGNWIIIQRRESGDPPFTTRSSHSLWYDYVTGGIGTAFTDHWLGADNIEALCSGPGKCELHITMEFHGDLPPDTNVNKTSDGKYHAHYDEFYLSYRALHVSGYSGNAEDALKELNCKYFKLKESNCWELPFFGDSGAWWYNHGCDTSSDLNGKWNATNGHGVIWSPITGQHNSLSFTEMKIRQKNASTQDPTQPNCIPNEMPPLPPLPP